MLKDYLNKIFKKREPNEVDKDLEKLSSDEIRNKIKYNKEFEERGEKLIHKRKENTLKEKIRSNFEDLISGGILILIIGLFYLGSIPVYFNVNNELTNPSNVSMGLNASLDVTQVFVTNSLFIRLMNIGAENPITWFWIWWLVVLFFFILPVLNIIYLIIKKYLKGGKKK
jgi:hypothetical protein